MKLPSLFASPVSALIFSVCAATAAIPAHADTISWPLSSVTSATPLCHRTIAPGITVTYSGQTDALLTATPVEASTRYTSSIIATLHCNNSLSSREDRSTQTITFSSALTNPVLAIRSLGQGNDPTAFVFTHSEPFSIVAFGPSLSTAAVPSPSPATTLSALKQRSYPVQRIFTTITFTTPLYENYYAFTVARHRSRRPRTRHLVAIRLACCSALCTEIAFALRAK